MGDLTLFLKKNKIQRNNTQYAATKSLVDGDGKPLMWEIKPLTTKDSEQMRIECTREIQVTGKPGVYRQQLDTRKYVATMLSRSVVYPDLYDATLQNSYGVATPEDLIQEIIDDPSEYNEFASFVQHFNGFDEKDRRSKKLINGGDPESSYAYYALHKLRILPSRFVDMDMEEKAFVMAAIDIRIQSEKKEAAALKQKTKTKKR